MPVTVLEIDWLGVKERVWLDDELTLGDWLWLGLEVAMPLRVPLCVCDIVTDAVEVIDSLGL